MIQGKNVNILSKLGPGLLYAGAAVGVSHLVQSTKAGAGFGWSLVWIVVAANVIKYPFFESGPRYATATGESLVEGYRRIGWLPVWIFILFTLGTMFVVQGAVTIVTAGLAQYMIEATGAVDLFIGDFDLGRVLWGKQINPETGVWTISGWQLSGRILLVSILVLVFGKYKLLDRLMKVIIILLTITTVVAVFAALFADFEKNPVMMQNFDWTDKALILAVIVPLVGWMPAPIDIAIWHSVWSLEKKVDQGGELSMKDSLFDFRIGYWGTTILAVFFVALGALIIWGSSHSLTEITSMPAGAFAKMLIESYATVLGDWARPIIAIAAFTTMLSTTLTCLDAFPRVLQHASQQVLPKLGSAKGLYWFWIILVGIGATWLLESFSGQALGKMVDFATALSFLTAPVLAGFNLMAMNGKHVPIEYRQSKGMQVFAILGLVFLVLFAGYYAMNRFF